MAPQMKALPTSAIRIKAVNPARSPSCRARRQPRSVSTTIADLSQGHVNKIQCRKGEPFTLLSRRVKGRKQIR